MSAHRESASRDTLRGFIEFIADAVADGVAQRLASRDEARSHVKSSNQPEFLNEAAVSAKTGLSRRTLQGWRGRGLGPTWTRAGGRVLYGVREPNNFFPRRPEPVVTPAGPISVDPPKRRSRVTTPVSLTQRRASRANGTHTAHPNGAVSPHVEDQRREVAISGAYEALIAAPSDDARRAAWTSMVRLIRGRSPQQVLRMEISRRLTTPRGSWRVSRCGVCGGPVPSPVHWLCADCAATVEERAA